MAVLKYRDPATNKWIKISQGSSSVNVVDNLTSTSTTEALSANQGRILKEGLDTKLAIENIKPGNNITIVQDNENITVNSLDEVQVSNNSPTENQVELWVDLETDSIEQQTEKSFITVGLNNPGSASSGETQVVFDKVVYNYGDAFTLQSNGSILINESCDLDLSLTFRFGWSNADKKNVLIYKNNELVSELSNNSVTANTVSLANVYMHVSAGDIIKVNALSNTPCSIVPQATFLSLSKMVSNLVIGGTGNYQENERGFIPSNIMTQGTIGGNSGKYYNLTFNRQYNNPPIVLVSFYSKRGITWYAAFNCMVAAITNTGCTLCIMEPNLNDAQAGIAYTVIPT